MATSGDDLDRDGIGPDDLEDVGMGPSCPRCGKKMGWLRCWNCGGEGSFDGFDEDPFWYDEEDLIPCQECAGEGGQWWCANCGQCFDNLGEGGEVGAAAASSSGGGAGEDAIDELGKEFLLVVKRFNSEEDHCACVDRDRAGCFRMRYGIEDMRNLAEEGGPCECVCHDRWEAAASLVEERWEEELPDRWWEMDDEEDGE